ncbi:MAG: NADH-quinone oxidoreductase subunit NuoE [Desulfobacterales bacterium]|jgi:NADH-quinone oxidoreductase subunit E
MLPQSIKASLADRVRAAEHPKELIVDVLFAVQDHFGYLSDDAMAEAAAIMEMTPLELEEISTFYTFLFREPVGRYVIHVCDSVVCWMDGYESLRDHLCATLGIELGGTTADGLFTVLPVCCIGYCDRSPAMMINKTVYGHLTPEKIDGLLKRLRAEADEKSGDSPST